MKIVGYEDLRVQRTIKSIYKAFESLIIEKDFEHITVSELAKRAEINKKTFYRYYPSLNDLLAELQARYTEEFLERTGNYDYPRDLEKSIRDFFEYSSEQGAAYDKITTNFVYQGIRQQMIDQVMDSTWRNSEKFNQLSDFERIALLKFIENTGLTLYTQWIDTNKKEPLENVITTAIHLVHGGVKEILYKEKE